MDVIARTTNDCPRKADNRSGGRSHALLPRKGRPEFCWLQLGTLGRKTGCRESWEARRSLDRVLRLNPEHVRARVARAWIDYIVGTTVPRGARWLLGGGNKKRGLLVVREVVETVGSDFFVRSEAMFALWDLQVREREVPEAVATARLLARDFPENQERTSF